MEQKDVHITNFFRSSTLLLEESFIVSLVVFDSIRKRGDPFFFNVKCSGSSYMDSPLFVLLWEDIEKKWKKRKTFSMQLQFQSPWSKLLAKFSLKYTWTVDTLKFKGLEKQSKRSLMKRNTNNKLHLINYKITWRTYSAHSEVVKYIHNFSQVQVRLETCRPLRFS